MNQTIESFLASVTSLHQLKAENLPKDVLREMAQMEANELYKLCTQLIVLQHNVPSKEKIITIDEDQLLMLVDKYAKALLERLKGDIS